MKRLFVLLVVAIVVIGGGAVPAQAADGSYSVSTSWDAGVPGCVKVTLSGTLRYIPDGYMSGTGQYISVKKNPRLVNPKATVRVRSSCSGKAKTATKVNVKQFWYYHSCSANPSIGVSYPWGAAASVTPTCGTNKSAYRSTTYPKGSTFEQNVSGTVATWKKKVDTAGPKVYLCVHAASDVTVYYGTKSYSKKLDLGKVCV